MQQLEQISYKHFGCCYRLCNDQIDLLVIGEFGPRIIRFGFIGAENEFAEVDFSLAIPGHGTWRLHGGHRFWHAPEDMIRTYIPDDEPVRVEEHGGFIRVRQPIEPRTGIEKELDISLAPDRPSANVVHRLRNHNLWSVELAPWALSAMRDSGTCILPLPSRGAPDPGELPGISTITLWQYSDMSDGRYCWGSDYIRIRHDRARDAPQKIGAHVTDGWAAYLRKGNLFLKTFDYVEDAIYPDRGCSVEVFFNEEFLEVETLGPLTQLAPGASIEHRESWQLFRDIPPLERDDEISDCVLPIVEQLRAEEPW
ncbi:MAG: hypothetical protein OXE52_03790 [Chloroflexi bacterium]|nr:hypothetical protein [Chloroflexota bacterium]